MVRWRAQNEAACHQQPESRQPSWQRSKLCFIRWEYRFWTEMRYVSCGVTAITSYTTAWQCISLEVGGAPAAACICLKHVKTDYSRLRGEWSCQADNFEVFLRGLIISLAFVHGRVGVYGYCGDMSRTTRRRIVLGAMFWMRIDVLLWPVRIQCHPAF